MIWEGRYLKNLNLLKLLGRIRKQGLKKKKKKEVIAIFKSAVAFCKSEPIIIFHIHN